MTVCIAAVCTYPPELAAGNQNVNAIVGCTDRMVTQGDTQFEVPGLSRIRPNAPFFKSVPLNRHVVVMTAGSAGFQAQALLHLWAATAESRTDTTGLWSEYPVRDIALRYIEFCNAQRRIATDTLLAPYGLNADTFISRQRELGDQFIRWVFAEVEEARDKSGGSIIVCGLDATGPHIYLCDGTDLSSMDTIGFSAIGSGGKHVRSQFTLGDHSRHDRMEHTALLAYVAKRRSEKAPGVGPETDMFVISPGRGWYFLQPAELEQMERIYTRLERSQDAAFRRAQAATVNYVASLSAGDQQQPPPQIPTDSTNPPASEPAEQSTPE